MPKSNAKIAKKLKLNGVSAKRQNEIVERVEKLIQEKIRISILTQLHADDIRQLTQLEDISDQNVSQFLSSKIPNYNNFLREVSNSVINTLVLK